VYAVAVMIYQLLEGRMPFDEARVAEVEPAAPAALTARQWQVLQSGFAYRQEDRPGNVAELLERLQRAAGPSPEELAREQAERAAEQARLREEGRRQEAAARAEQVRVAEQQRLKSAAEQAARRQAEAEAAAQAAQAAALEKQRQERVRRELEARQRAEAEAAAQKRKQQLREQLQARREADAQKLREQREEQQRKAQQIKADAAYRAEQERHRKEQAARHAAELAALMPTPSSPVADAEGVLRDRFLDGAGAGPELVLIPTGRFQMGANEHEHAAALKAGAQKTWLARETPQRWVGIAHSIALGRYPVTLGQWKQFVRATGWESQSDTDWRLPGYAQTDEHPVVGVSWNDVQLYLRWLSDATGQLYRLPSEAEWEYACRAGTRTAFSFGDTISPEQANYDGNYTYNAGPKGQFRQGTTKVGAFPPNPWGLFDMHGNVWEWVQDVVHDSYQGAPVDGSAWEEGGDQVRRVLRGGSWLYSPRYLRSAARNGYSAVLANDIVGFRVARKLA
jgi:formylglycine-generating enzyme required for sulfatase activity